MGLKKKGKNKKGEAKKKSSGWHIEKKRKGLTCRLICNVLQGSFYEGFFFNLGGGGILAICVDGGWL